MRKQHSPALSMCLALVVVATVISATHTVSVQEGGEVSHRPLDPNKPAGGGGAPGWPYTPFPRGGGATGRPCRAVYGCRGDPPATTP